MGDFVVEPASSGMTVERLLAVIAEKDARIADLEAVLGLHEDSRLEVAFSLSPAISKLLHCLLKTPNVTPEMITSRLGIATDSKVAIHRLRGALKPFGIEVQGKRGLGYWIEAEDKERIWAMAKAVATPKLVVDNAAVA